MDSTDNDSLRALTDEQIERLAAIVVEDFGLGLSRPQFNGVVLLMFEDVAGFDVMPQREQASHLRALWITAHHVEPLSLIAGFHRGLPLDRHRISITYCRRGCLHLRVMQRTNMHRQIGKMRRWWVGGAYADLPLDHF